MDMQRTCAALLCHALRCCVVRSSTCAALTCAALLSRSLTATLRLDFLLPAASQPYYHAMARAPPHTNCLTRTPPFAVFSGTRRWTTRWQGTCTRCVLSFWPSRARSGRATRTSRTGRWPFPRDTTPRCSAAWASTQWWGQPPTLSVWFPASLSLVFSTFVPLTHNLFAHIPSARLPPRPFASHGEHGAMRSTIIIRSSVILVEGQM